MTSRFIAAAESCVALGVGALGVFLWEDFSPWTMGLGVLVGAPLTLFGMGIYFVTVFRELRRHGEL